jgi:hypothetical protein
MRLSSHQEEALAKAQESGGLHYVRGGYWVQLSVSPEAFLAFDGRSSERPWHTTTRTVQGLVRRGLLVWAETSKGYPTKALVP